MVEFRFLTRLGNDLRIDSILCPDAIIMNEDQTISSQPLRPLHRRASITASPHASTIPLTQERRRKEALELQRSVRIS